MFKKKRGNIHFLLESRASSGYKLGFDKRHPLVISKADEEGDDYSWRQVCQKN